MKTTMKRLLAMCLTVAMLLSFAACGEKTEDPATQPTTAPSKQAATPSGFGHTAVTEVKEDGTEAQLTAVRQSLIKKSEIEGLGDIEKMELYVNGYRTKDSNFVKPKDNKKIYWSGDVKRVVNYADGYILDIPTDWVPDYSLGKIRVRYDTDEVSLIATREDEAVGRYGNSITEYMNNVYRHLKNPTYLQKNDITVLDQKKVELEDDWTMEVYKVVLNGCAEGVKCYYTYVDYYNDVNKTYHMMFKSVDDRDFADVYNSFKDIAETKAGVSTKTYAAGYNPNWSKETKAHYDALCKQKGVEWGLFSYKLQTTGWKNTIPMLEKRIDFKFPIISEYIHFGTAKDPGEFPTKFAKKCVKDGRTMQITFQYTANNNSDLNDHSPMLDIYRRTDEAKEILTNFAEGAADFGLPFYFRLNNEMNTDWTSYSGIANMLDPDIFVDTWVQLYDIFTETGANKYAIWIFNGFDNSFPPFKWCDYLCYFPDAKYVDMLGLTGYNFVTPEDTTTWRSFQEIYSDIEQNYKDKFGDWAWIISEFGCETSTDPSQSKAEWITGMFDCFEKGMFPNIKVAIWFNCSDYVNGVATNDLNLEKDKEVYTAFKEGIAKTQK